MFNGKDLLSSSLTKENILLRIRQEDIFKKYVCEPGDSIKSPFRQDKKPSCGFYRSEFNGCLLLHDFSTGEKWDCFSASMKMLNCNFVKILHIINEDFNLGLGGKSPSKVAEVLETVDEKTCLDTDRVSLNIKVWDDIGLKYWTRYGINQSILNLYSVYALSSVSRNEKLMWKSTLKSPIYAYITPGMEEFKLYRPYAEPSSKWYAKVSGKNLFGIYNLPPKGKLLIITKSAKDVMVLYSLGFYAIAPYTETARISSKQIQELKSRFTNIVSIYDNDATGVRSANNLLQNYAIKACYIPKVKDVSDYRCKYGSHSTLRMLKKLLAHAFKQ